jgi:hypothetical protein
MDDQDVLSRIKDLMDEEQQLRSGQGDGGHPLRPPERERLRLLEEQLDQCWDLLRQRRAREEFGQDPDAANARPTDTVEGYWQ